MKIPGIVNLTGLASFGLAVLLAGCGKAPPATQIVEVPVHTPCVTDLPVAPVYEFDKLPSDASDGAKILALARDLPLGRKYEVNIVSLLISCKM